MQEGLKWGEKMVSISMETNKKEENHKIMTKLRDMKQQTTEQIYMMPKVVAYHGLSQTICSKGRYTEPSQGNTSAVTNGESPSPFMDLHPSLFELSENLGEAQTCPLLNHDFHLENCLRIAITWVYHGISFLDKPKRLHFPHDF